MTSANSGWIYAIFNVVSGRAYVGSTVDLSGRQRDHFWYLRRGKHHCRRLQASWNRHGQAYFEWRVLEHLVVADGAQLIVAERRWMLLLKDIYNAVVPAEGDGRVLRHSLETLARMSASQKRRGNAPSAEARRLSLLATSGAKRSSEARARMSAAKLGKKQPLSAVAKRAAIKSKWHKANRQQSAAQLDKARARITAASRLKGWSLRRTREMEMMAARGQMVLALASVAP